MIDFAHAANVSKIIHNNDDYDHAHNERASKTD